MSLLGQIVVTPDCLKKAEGDLMREGVSEDELIFRAAKALSVRIGTIAAVTDKILFVTGGGNNGCDGLECALLLRKSGYDVSVMPIGDKRNEGNRARLEKIKQTVPVASEIGKSVYKVVVDCVFGIGLTGAPLGEYRRAISEINGSGAFVLSADIPSGLDANSGEIYGACVYADETVTFSAVKTGLILGEGRNYAGKITVADIGIRCDAEGRITSDKDAFLPPRKPVTHKGSYGKVRVIGGSDIMPGAPLMCFESALAASRAGAGLVTLCVPQSEKAAYQSRVKETMLKFLPSANGRILFDERTLDEIIDGADSIVVGPGMGRGGDAAAIVGYLAHNFSGTLVVDADALNAVACDKEIIVGHKCGLILTPHVVEFSRLCREGNPGLDTIRGFAADFQCALAVKSATTVVTDGVQIFFNVTGGPALSKGGSGDVLAGMAAAFACVLSPFDALKAACFHFGKAGERASERLNSVTSVLASDVIIEIESAP